MHYFNNTSEYERFINMFSDSKMYLNDFIVHNLIKKNKCKKEKKTLLTQIVGGGFLRPFLFTILILFL